MWFFYVRQLEMSKLAFVTYIWLFDHCTDENRDIALKFGMCIVCRYIFLQHIPFFYNSKVLDFIGIKIEILSFGVKIENVKNLR